MRDMEIDTKAGSITRRKVWHVPNLGGTLMSVSLIVDTGNSLEFGYTASTVCRAGVQTYLGHRVEML